MSGPGKHLRALERAYRRERAEIIADESLSWETRMRLITKLFERYAQRRGELREPGLAAEEDGAA